MLNSLKKALKQMLIEKQHKLYNEELSARKLTYDMWIKQQEEGLEIAEIISAQQKKCLKKETGITENETLISKNDGELAKNASAGLYELKFDLGSEKAQPGRIFWLKNEFSVPVIQALTMFFR